MTNIQTTPQQSILTVADSRLFFIALTANGMFSLLSGLAMLTQSTRLAALIGLDDARWLLATGAGLLLFGGLLLLHATRKRLLRMEAIAISALDLGWVIGSVLLVLLVPGLFNATGIVAVLIVAAVVFTFFELQAFALWKVSKQRSA